MPGAEIAFNYLGQFDQTLASGEAGGGFWLAEEGHGPEVAAAQVRRHLLEFNAVTGDGRLTMTLVYSPAHHTAATAREIGRRVQDAVARGDWALCATGGRED